MRQRGQSIRNISSDLSVAKSTVSLWCRNIELTKNQVKKLLINKKEGATRGRLRGAATMKKRRIEKINKYEKEGMKKFKFLNKNEFLVAGLALYLGEGSKKERRVSFINSDPRIIKFVINWLKQFFDVNKKSLVFSVMINDIHRPRENVLIKYWSNYLGMSASQFRKTVFIKAKQKKVYKNYHNHYGILKIRVLKSSDLFYKIMGLIDGIMISKTRLRSSTVRTEPS